MNKSNHFPSIDLIMGPMFAGKTTELLRKLSIYKDMGLRCLYVNSIKDTRTSSNFSTHNKNITNIDNIDSAKINTESIELFQFIDNYDVIGIDEAQLFYNLYNTIKIMTEKHHKKILVSGLISDSDRNPFGDIIKLIPISTSIKHLTAFCSMCCKNNIITPAIFTKSIKPKSSTILIGDKDTYIAVCRSCYIHDSEQIYELLQSTSSSDSSDETTGLLSNSVVKDFVDSPISPDSPTSSTSVD